MRGFILGLFLPPLLSSLFRAGFKDDTAGLPRSSLFRANFEDDTAGLPLSSLFWADFEDEARRPATVGQSEAGQGR